MKIIKQCTTCKDNFYTTQKKLGEGKGKYCTKKCFYKDRLSKSTIDCVICRKQIIMKPSRIKSIKEGTSCSKECYRKYMSTIASKRVLEGHKNNNFNRSKGCGLTTDGYVWVYHKNGYHNQIKLHRYLMEIKLGRKLLSSEIVHHIDEDKLNNTIENLQIMTRTEHNKVHKFLHR